METQKPLAIGNKKTPAGFSIIVGKDMYEFSYPLGVWRAFPDTRKQEFINTITTFATYHLALAKPRHITYTFPTTIGLSLYFQGLLYSLASTEYEFPDRPFTASDLIRDAYNSNFRIKFTGTPFPASPQKPYPVRKNSVLMPFSFGKDSLLTFSILKKFGFTVCPYYFQEPASTQEVKTKLQLKKTFEKTFDQKLYTFPLQLGKLRDSGEDMWGWDMLLTQYTLLLLPYVYFHKPEFFCWSDEQTLNNIILDPNGYFINPTHEQNAQWILHLNTLYRHFHANTILTSIVEPLYDMMMLHMLHNEFGEAGTYQLSCDLPETPHHDHRWCGQCHECARQYILMLGAGINPSRVGLRENMLAMGKKHLHHIFIPYEEKHGINALFQSEKERLFAFYLAYQRGVRGGVMDLFEKMYLKSIAKEEKQLTEKFFTPVEPQCIPDLLQSKIMPFYRSYGEKIKKEIRKGRLAPVDRS